MQPEENFFQKVSKYPYEIENQAISHLLKNSENLDDKLPYSESNVYNIWSKAYNLVKEILALNYSYEIFLLDSESDPAFSIAALLYSKGYGNPAYVDTGMAASKAIEKAMLFSKVEVVASSKESGYNYIPDGPWAQLSGSYLHITIGNLAEGTQIKKIPKVSIPLIADASSGLCSREVMLKEFDLLYCVGGAGNCHPGITMIIAKREYLTDFQRSILIRYAICLKDNYSNLSFSNLENFLDKLNWIVEVGGLSTLIFLNKKKALMLYREIERNRKFYCLIKPEFRAEASILFAAFNPEDEEVFINFSKTLECKLNVVKSYNHGLLVILENTDTIDDVEQLVMCFQYFEEN